MIRRIIQLGIASLLMATAAWAQQPRGIKLERDDFFREILSRSPSPRTLYYDTSVPGSYQIMKLDTLRALPEKAKSQNLELRGLLMVGPYGPTTVYSIYVFVAEKNLTRVIQLTVSSSRFTYKSTGTMTGAEYDQFWDGLLKANVVRPGMPEDELQQETLMARWSNGNLKTFFGSMINPAPGAKANDFGKILSRLLHSLTKTYPLPLNARPTR